MAALPYAATRGSAKAAHASHGGSGQIVLPARRAISNHTRQPQDSNRTAQAEPIGSRRSASRPSSAWRSSDPRGDMHR
jgi:hypothetical protein